MRKMFKVLGIVVIVIALIYILFYILVVSGTIFMFYSNPPTPEMQYGEFPFTLTYELNGEIKVIRDTVICEFDGFINRGAAGKSRRWKTTLKSGNDRLTLLDLRPLKEENELEQTILELYFYYGTGAYYMGDTENPFARGAQDFDWIDYTYQTKDGKIGGSGFRAEEAFEKYKIRLISWECAPPIENKFQ